MLKEPSGSINTDGFPNLTYAPNSNCMSIIDLPAAYKTIELAFDEIDIEEPPGCVKDQVTILNGREQLQVASYH